MRDLRITVDLAAAEPPYEQVRAQIAGLIATGQLGEGDRLPTVRALAADLGLAVNTGTVVAPGSQSMDIALSRTAAAYAERAVAGGLSDAAAIDLVRAALRQARS